jgi:MFS family permease
MAQFLQIGLHYDAFGAGLRLMPWGAAIFVVAPLVGSRISRVGERPFIVGGMLLVTAGGTWLALVAKPHLSYWHVVVPLVITGIGMSMAIPATQSSVMSYVAPQHIDRASGTFTTLRQLGGAFGVAIRRGVRGVWIVCVPASVQRRVRPCARHLRSARSSRCGRRPDRACAA